MLRATIKHIAISLKGVWVLRGTRASNTEREGERENERDREKERKREKKTRGREGELSSAIIHNRNTAAHTEPVRPGRFQG